MLVKNIHNVNFGVHHHHHHGAQYIHDIQGYNSPEHINIPQRTYNKFADLNQGH